MLWMRRRCVACGAARRRERRRQHAPTSRAIAAAATLPRGTEPPPAFVRPAARSCGHHDTSSPSHDSAHKGSEVTNTAGANEEEVTDKEGSRTTQTTQFMRKSAGIQTATTSDDNHNTLRQWRYSTTTEQPGRHVSCSSTHQRGRLSRQLPHVLLRAGDHSTHVVHHRVRVGVHGSIAASRVNVALRASQSQTHHHTPSAGTRCDPAGVDSAPAQPPCCSGSSPCSS
jgi:hypothetical protein